MTASLRPANPGDESFLRRLITETIVLELGASAWPEPMRSHLVEVQYSGRSRHSGESFIVEADAQAAGWLLLQRMPHELRVVEVMIAPELRGQGIGSAALRQIVATAGTPVSLTVNLTNAAAVRLYERLGFRIVESNEVQHVMWYGSR